MNPTIKTHSKSIFLMVCVVLGSCTGVETGKELPTAKSVNLTKYVGTWYEVARLPMWAQRKCVRSMAQYWLLDSGDIGVLNSCVTAEGEEMSIEGTATIVDLEHQAKLNVQFNRWWATIGALFARAEQGNYWILRVDPEYQFAVVGTPDREYLWILARTPTPQEATYQELVTFSQGLGFQTEDLIRRQAEQT